MDKNADDNRETHPWTVNEQENEISVLEMEVM
jgi:hypothetical protein